MKDFRAVSVISSGPCCEPVGKYLTSRTVCSQAPRLPLDVCTMPDRCQCRFKKFNDRRDGEDRRPAAWHQRGVWYAGTEKRDLSPRRFADR